MALRFEKVDLGKENKGKTAVFKMFKLENDMFDEYMGLSSHNLFSSLTLPTIQEYGVTGIFMFSYSDEILTDDITFEIAIENEEDSQHVRGVLIAPEIKETTVTQRDNNNNITDSETIIKKPNGRIIQNKEETLTYQGIFFKSHQEAIST